MTEYRVMDFIDKGSEYPSTTSFLVVTGVDEDPLPIAAAEAHDADRDIFTIEESHRHPSGLLIYWRVVAW